jgi:hypothetical protein
MTVSHYQGRIQDFKLGELNPGPTKEDELSIFHLNTRSMRHKLDYIESICNEADIICLTETHLL